MSRMLRLVVWCDHPGCYARTVTERAFIEGWESSGDQDYCHEHRKARFTITEEPVCMCGMRVFSVRDNQDGTVSRAHVGGLDPHDAGHRAVRELLRRERESL
jgi:hypothetical protein